MAWAFGGGAASSGVIVNPQTAMQSTAVYACIKVLAESLGQLPLITYERTVDGRVLPALKHPAYDLLANQPNEYQTIVEFLEMMVCHLNLRGNSYAYINRTRSGQVVELLPLHPDTVNVRMENGWNLTYQITLNDGGMKTVDRSEILHVRGLTLNGWLGIAPIAYARESIGLALATEKFGSQLFRNGAKMGGVLSHPGKLGDIAYERLKNSFDEATSGENSHKTALLEEGMKWEKMSMTADDSQFLETRKYQRSEIAGVFRVPPHLIGDLERTTFANIEQQSIDFVQNGMQPIANRVEKALIRDVFTKEERSRFFPKFDMSELLRGDAKTQAEADNIGVLGGWLTRNEARIKRGYNPIDGLDEPLMPLNMIELNDAEALDADKAESVTEETDGL